jgi:hypothetical protein
LYLPGEVLYRAGRKVLIKGYHPKNKGNPYSCFTISDLKGKNVVTKVPLHTVAMSDPPETTADRIWARLNKELPYPVGMPQVQLVHELGLNPSLVKKTCNEMTLRGHLGRTIVNEIRVPIVNETLETLVQAWYYQPIPPKNRPCVLVQWVPAKLKTAFERLVGKDMFE